VAAAGRTAGLIREEEAADFAANEAELVEAVNTRGRAIGIWEKEMVKNPAAWPRLIFQTSTTL